MHTKIKITILSFFVLVLLQSCQSTPTCELRSEYNIRVTSDVYDDYALFVDGRYVEDIPALGFVELSVSEGYHEVYLEQLEGFRTQPNTEIYDVYGVSCDYYDILFPD